MRVFVAGAAGAIGQQLLPQLTAQGHQVTATTRSPGKLELLRGLGAEAVVIDGLDAAAVGEAVARSEPEVVVHQMTSLAAATSLRRFDKEFAATSRLRTAGTEHLLAAAAAAGARRFIAQSYTGWTNVRAGGPVKGEDDPLDRPARGAAPDAGRDQPPGTGGTVGRAGTGDRAEVRLPLRPGRVRYVRQPGQEAAGADHWRRGGCLVVPARLRRRDGDRRRARPRRARCLQRRRRRAS